VHTIPDALKATAAAAANNDNAAAAADKLKELFRHHPLNGIFSAGWLEKHVLALPSVIVVVCTVLADPDEQEEYDLHLFKTIEHIAYSLASKRK